VGGWFTYSRLPPDCDNSAFQILANLQNLSIPVSLGKWAKDYFVADFVPSGRQHRLEKTGETL